MPALADAQPRQHQATTRPSDAGRAAPGRRALAAGGLGAVLIAVVLVAALERPGEPGPRPAQPAGSAEPVMGWRIGQRLLPATWPLSPRPRRASPDSAPDTNDLRAADSATAPPTLSSPDVAPAPTPVAPPTAPPPAPAIPPAAGPLPAQPGEDFSWQR